MKDILMRRHLWRTLALLLCLGGVLLLANHFYQQTPYARAQALAAARARWAERDFYRYRVELVYLFRHRTNPVTYVYDIPRESAGRKPYAWFSYSSVTKYFDLIEEHAQTLEPQCRSGLNCHRLRSDVVHATYDSELGYPRVIELSRVWHPDWFNIHFWVWLVQSGTWQECENITCTRKDSLQTITVENITPLDEQDDR
jgi:hypothetical protein